MTSFPPSPLSLRPAQRNCSGGRPPAVPRAERVLFAALGRRTRPTRSVDPLCRWGAEV